MTLIMKANRTIVLSKDDRAEVGVGTLIVFIAMVLVAAVAAAVLINTSGTLQERAMSTGKEATQEVSSNLRVVGVYGVRNDTGTADDIWDVKVNVELSAGAQKLDMTKLIVRYSDGSNVRNYNHTDIAITDEDTPRTWFNATWVRGSGGSTFVMEPGDLVTIHFNTYNHEIVERTDIELLLVPESGTPVAANFKTPPTYATDTIVTLR